MSIKVLVADDSITIQKVIGIIFGGGEYSLTVVDNGKSAVEKAREINPDILLIDALMPGMSGYEVAEAVRSTPALASKPILILTGSFEPFDEEKAKRCGADDFIAKPFESQQIITKVKELLALGNSRAQQSAQVSPPQPVQQAQESSAPAFDIQQPAAPADIWSAFTPEAEPQVEAPSAPVADTPIEATKEPDVFAIVNEESDAQLVQADATIEISPSHTGSQWVPVEENTFEFEEEMITAPLQTILADQQVPLPETSFGDISFEDDAVAPAPPVAQAVSEPVFSVTSDVTDFTAQSPELEAPEPELETPAIVETVAPVAAVAPSQPLNLTEEQLRAAIMSASKDVIERIVWEVVPDLAEAMIREAISKIKAGA
ncbi:MAG: response regulator [Desulfuromonadaceae bacterium]|nr:response regulator [Desulfuromonadaceae bacterium]MDD2846861.1 response regulator [Desulfuromonadaceae bacterium]MDD4129161.1 response regulator [Desulfuromonadaceae bacterium]